VAFVQVVAGLLRHMEDKHATTVTRACGRPTRR